MSHEDGFIGRWSRRKALARRQIGIAALPESEAAPPDLTAEPRETAALPNTDDGAAVPQHDRSDETADRAEADVGIREEDLPDIETLDAESDFTVFMQKGVPERLRSAALRRLWQMDPVLANVDGLVDYGEDFTDAATVVEGMSTLYRVGKGLLSDEQRIEMGLDEPESEADPEAAEEAEIAGNTQESAPQPPADTDSVAPSSKASSEHAETSGENATNGSRPNDA